MCNDRHEMAKYASTLADVKHGLEERLQQWTEYEGTFDRIISWLNESEALLKNYGPKNTLQEKTEQLDRFQVCDMQYFYSLLPAVLSIRCEAVIYICILILHLTPLNKKYII